MSRDYFEDRTTFEDRYCKKCKALYPHRVLSQWGVKATEGKKGKIPLSNWRYEREIKSFCTQCYPFAAQRAN